MAREVSQRRLRFWSGVNVGVRGKRRLRFSVVFFMSGGGGKRCFSEDVLFGEADFFAPASLPLSKISGRWWGLLENLDVGSLSGSGKG